ncbi:hypothetical protein [Oryzomonas rubra]|uniref:hypothetical protein n=1 Tax=Oryzomonas rubra TaxID=2509454 RepID=UPI00165E89C6|nr:hypothetical protein [Oryzomonas rubra]
MFAVEKWAQDKPPLIALWKNYDYQTYTIYNPSLVPIFLTRVPKSLSRWQFQEQDT